MLILLLLLLLFVFSVVALFVIVIPILQRAPTVPENVPKRGKEYMQKANVTQHFQKFILSLFFPIPPHMRTALC